MPTARQLHYKYKTKEITKKVLKSLLLGGVIYIAASSPYFIINLMRYYQRYGWPRWNKKRKQELHDTFSYLKRRGLINIVKKNHQIYISLTSQGKKRAKFYQIDELEIKKPKKWDKRWRLLIFDIAENARFKREALRGKIKELGFYPLQKSVWVYPYKCGDEVKLLQDFFGFDDNCYLLIETHSLGKSETKTKKWFNLQ